VKGGYSFLFESDSSFLNLLSGFCRFKKLRKEKKENASTEVGTRMSDEGGISSTTRR